MKKTISLILCLILVLLISGCGTSNSKKAEPEEEQLIQDLKVIAEADGRVTEGILEGYHFVETEEKTNRVKIEMEDGSIILIVLSNSKTPITIENFKNLVDQKFYDGLIYHRVIKDFMIQGGDPTGTGFGDKSIPTIKGEFRDNGVKNTLSHTRGVISMARSEDLNSASTQFFIVHQDSTYLDGLYASFGKVFAGMDAVDAIATTETDSNDRPLTEQKIKTIRFINIKEGE